MKSGYGNILKQRREELKLKLEDIASELKTEIKYIEALEEENSEAFEKPIYMKLFLKTYASFLKLNVEEILDMFENSPEIQEKEKKIHPKQPPTIIKEEIVENLENNDEKSNFLSKKNILFALSIVIIILLIILLIIFNNKKINKTTENSKNAEVYDVNTLKTLKVIAKAKEDVWMKVKYNDKEEAFLLKSGDERKWSDIKKIVFLIGNAGGVEFIVNGDNIGTIGEEGEVINGLVFEAGKNWYIDKKQGFKRPRQIIPAPTEIIIPTPTPAEKLDSSSNTYNSNME